MANNSGHPLRSGEPGKPLLSIVIPTFQRPRELRSCLRSIIGLGVGNKKLQVVVVNDGSSLSYRHAIEDAADEIDFVYIERANQGPGAARNLGAARAAGRYLAFLDDDCTLPPEWFAAVAANVTPATVLGGRTRNGLPGNLCATASQALIDYLYNYYNRDQACFFTSNNLIVPAEIFALVGGFAPAFRLAAAEDRDFCDRLLSAGVTLRYVPEIVVHHRHRMGLSGFLKQHYGYGVGARTFHRLRVKRTGKRIRLEPLHFYLRLIFQPFRQERFHRAFTIALLLGISQLANAAGFAASGNA